VLSSAKIGRSSWRYYQHTVARGLCEYYLERGDAPGRWHGDGLAPLGLAPGAVVQERELEALFARAVSPTSGAQLGAGWRDGSVTGHDLTFSAPKSVSALWALGDEQVVREIEAAHGAAVRAGLDYLQRHASYSRRGRDGVEQISTAGYAAALFEHGTSRTGDPQLHTHALVVNKVKCADGAWRTLDGREVYHHKKAAGALYQAALRAEITARLPVRFGPVSEHGQAEIDGVPAELASLWSTRTSAVMADASPTIAQAEADLGRALSPAERARVVKASVLATRPPKARHPNGDRRAVWAGQAATAGWDWQRLAAAVHAPAIHAAAVVRAPLAPPATALTAVVAAPGAGDVSSVSTAASIAAVPGRGAAHPDQAESVRERARLLAEAVTAVGRTKAVWSRADLAVAVAARIDTLTEPLPTSAAAMSALVEQLTGTALVPTSPAAVPVADRDALSMSLSMPGAALSTPTMPTAPTTSSKRSLAPVEVGVVDLGLVRSGNTARASDARYASRELIETEARIIDRVIAGVREPRPLPARLAGLTVTGPRGVQLSGEQQRAVLLLAASQDLLTVLTAPAGAGKTTALAAAVAVWQACARPVITLAPSARAAAELAEATGTDGHTVASWLTRHRDDPGVRPAFRGLDPRPVLLVDEASMLTTADLDELTRLAQAQNASLVLVGDPGQLGAVNAPGGMFEHLLDVLAARRIELTGLHRYHQSWEAAATLRLREGDPTILDTYLAHGRIHPETSSQDAADAVFDRWHTATAAGREALMLAQSWTDVTALNARARAAAITLGQVTGPDLAVVATSSRSTRGQVEDRAWRAGDLLITKQNTRHIQLGDRSLRNGDRFRVLDTDKLLGTSAPTAAAGTGGAGTGVGLRVQHLDTGAITVLPDWYLARHTEYGWAATIDSAQGATTEVAVLLARPGLDREHLYVAMSRGRAENHVHTHGELDTGDAGPHRSPSIQRGEQLVLPDHGAALDVLSRAVMTSGRERAAHAVSAGAIHNEREATWWRTEHQRPAEPIPVEHARRLDQLQRASARQAAATARVDALRVRLAESRNQLAGLRFWSRSRRTELTALITSTNGALDRAQADLSDADRRVAELRAAVQHDTRTRHNDATTAQRARHETWTSHAPAPHPEPVIVPEPDPDLWPDQDPWSNLVRSPARSHERGPVLTR
jgi:conjugative relaxase-like TrwC/TraI family protein